MTPSPSPEAVTLEWITKRLYSLEHLRYAEVAEIIFEKFDSERTKAKGLVEAMENMLKVDPSLLHNALGSAYAIKHYVEIREALKQYQGDGK